jgi:periplasmic protein TonB
LVSTESTARPPDANAQRSGQKTPGQRQADGVVPTKIPEPTSVAPRTFSPSASVLPPASPKDAATATRKPAAEKPTDEPPAAAKQAVADAKGEGSVKPAPEPAAGSGAKQPTRLKYVAPVYPKAALDAGAEGVIILEATIGEDGHIRDVKVLRSIPLLDQAAIDAVKQWEYTPTILNGKPTPVVIAITLTFAI